MSKIDVSGTPSDPYITFIEICLCGDVHKERWTVRTRMTWGAIMVWLDGKVLVEVEEARDDVR